MFKKCSDDLFIIATTESNPHIYQEENVRNKLWYAHKMEFYRRIKANYRYININASET